MSGWVLSVNVSTKKGEIKKPADCVRVTAAGLEHDAHAGSGHRQVSLLPEESIKKLSTECGRDFKPGEFAENITTTGIDLKQVAIRDHLTIGPVELEITQIGKKCHGDGCAIRKQTGKCVMPAEGLFAKVIKEGEIRPGDKIGHTARPLKILVITLSDRASHGEYEDKSGPVIRDILTRHFSKSHWQAEIKNLLLSDDAIKLKSEIQNHVNGGTDIIFTTGGTGIGPRDITPDVIRPILDREIPGIMEYIRTKYGQQMPSALLSRSIAGMRGSTLIYALPGSVRAVTEYLDEILKTLDHALAMIAGIDLH